MRCDRRRTSLLTSWPFLAVGVLFVIGVLLLAISSAMMRSAREESAQKPVTWPQMVDESFGETDAPLRLEMVERLGILDTEWSRGILQQAQQQEPDPQVRSAIDLALR